MDPIRNIKLRWLHGALQDVTYELSRSQFSRFAPHAWEPAINAYRCETCTRICVDLAGVERSLIELAVEPRRVVIRGTRELPEPTHEEGNAVQLLAMEIDYGPFIREVPLPAEVEIDRAPGAQSTIAAPMDRSQTPRIPEELSILPVRGFVVFPGTVIPLNIQRAASLKLLDDTLPRTKVIGLLAQRAETKEDPTPQDLYSMGTVALVLKLIRQADDQIGRA